MCVPLCAPIEYAESVNASPLRMSFRKSNFSGASPSYIGVVAGSSVAVTSIHPLDIGDVGEATESSDCRWAVHESASASATTAMKREMFRFVSI